jgi:hypothetical protein
LKPRTYDGITPTQFAAIAAAVKSKTGIPVSGDVGQASGKGITISWNYDPQAQTLVLTPLKRAWYDPSEATIDLDLDALVKGAR